ncbi:hypothetical protein [Hansschlegelia beijingensis]|uniref:Uncharacterized protein n=1 Tax=Hansschlegelia beijingensis TaxID=1133344 RepID=A0A7W6D4W0_9HYPH|nr:hypothetical protein [Hansschlegelia beijingensis]MBB3972194.1 hypothetical protein [Hansschlegelia beijingensis]
MDVLEPTDAVVWLTDITLSEAEIKVEVSTPPYDYGRQGANGLAYAKYVVSDDGWKGVATFFRRHGDAIRRLIESGAIGAATLDVAFVFPAERISRSAEIPPDVAAIVGASGVSLVISTYPSDGS